MSCLDFEHPHEGCRIDFGVLFAAICHACRILRGEFHTMKLQLASNDGYVTALYVEPGGRSRRLPYALVRKYHPEGFEMPHLSRPLHVYIAKELVDRTRR